MGSRASMESWVGSWQAVSTSGFDGDVRSLKTFSDGTILVTGAFRHFGNIFQPCLALLNSDGSLNDRFSIGKGNIPSSGTVYDCLKLEMEDSTSLVIFLEELLLIRKMVH